MKKIDNIIQETIDNFVNESIISEGTLDDIKSMIFNGEIKDSKTISAILAYSEMLRK